MNSPSRTLAALVLGMLCSMPLAALAGPNDALQNILVSKTNGITTLQIWPACKMRYLEHTPSEAGLQLRIKFEVTAECDELMQDIETEVYRPLGKRMAKVSEVTFSAENKRNVYITLNFTEPQKFAVNQHTVGWIDINVDTTVASASLPRNMPEAVAKAPTPEPRALPRQFAANSYRSVAPLATTTRPNQNIAPSTEGDFVVQLGVFENVDTAVAELLRNGTEHFGYATEFTVNGKTWHGLQVGFFDSEAEAELVLRDLQSSFPDSWVRYVEPAEAATAKAGGELRERHDDQAAPVAVASNNSVSEAELKTLMQSGRKALIDRRYDDAILHYTAVLQAPGNAYRADAREFIGVAHERNGQPRNAIAEYQAYLAENPTADGVGRVHGRLTALETAGNPVDRVAFEPNSDGTGEWQINGGLSHYYWRNQQQLVNDGNFVVSNSGVLALGHFAASRRGERFDILTRFNGAYQFNLVEYDDDGDTAWVSSAFVDVVDKKLDLRGRIGRQNLREAGVLGRFDGAALNYQWTPDISFGVSGGFPIDSPRYVTETHRAFVAANARIDNLWDRVSVTAFTQQQTVDGILDRQAVGGEVEYRQGPLSVIGLIDFDLSYAVLNSALVNAAWHMENDWIINARVNVGAQPYLTTRNALAGQSVRSIDELLETYTEGQIRTLARDRTAQASSASVGLTVPLSERFNVTVDAAARQADATVASGGVAAMPATGTEVSLNTTLVGTNLWLENDLSMLTLRQDSTRTRDSSTLIVDTRLPFGRSLRINPRIGVTQMTLKEQNSEQLILRPSLRALYRWESLLIDLEVGATWSNRELPEAEWDPFTTDGVEELAGGYVNLGYRWEF